MFEDDLIVIDGDGVRYENNIAIIDYVATIFCDGIPGDDEENKQLVIEFLNDNELGELPTTARDWIDILNQLSDGWKVK